MAVQIPIAIAALTLGIYLGNRFTLISLNDSEAPSTDPEAAIRKKMRAAGVDLVVNRAAQRDAGSDLSAYLTHVYRGLYKIGRTGATLKPRLAEELATELRHLHHQHRPQKDKALVAWYETIGVNNEHRLSDLLAGCTEIKRLGVDPRYIAYVFGETSEDLSFAGLLDELV